MAIPPIDTNPKKVATVSLVAVLKFSGNIDQERLQNSGVDQDDQIVIGALAQKIINTVNEIIAEQSFQDLSADVQQETFEDAIEDILEERANDIASLNHAGHRVLTDTVDEIADTLARSRFLDVKELKINIPPMDDNIGGSRVEKVDPDGRPRGPQGGGSNSLAAEADASGGAEFTAK